MKIAVSTAGFFPETFGGGQVYVYRLAKELLRRGHNVYIISSAPWQTGNGEYAIESYDYGGLPIRAVKLNPNAISAGDVHSELSPVLVKSLENLLKQLNPDLVHLNGMKAALITTCKGLNIPHVVTAHHPGFACPAGDLLTPDENLCEKRAHAKVCIPCCSIRRTSNHTIGSLLGRLPRWLYRPIGKTLNRYRRIPYVGRGLMFPWLIEKRLEGQEVRVHSPKFTISPSEAMKKLLIRNGMDPSNIFLLPHGIEPIKGSPGKGNNGERVRFGYIGALNRAKGFHILLQSLERIESQEYCELHVFGGAQNPWDNAFVSEYMARYHGKARITNHGYISHDELSNAFTEFDVLVVPSVYLEVFGLVILEAFSAGKPVIASKCGGPEELVRDGIDGFVVERNDSQSLAEAMQGFVNNRKLMFEMSKNIPHVKTMQEYVDEVLEIYRQVILEM